MQTPILQYDFTSVSSTIVPDITGHGFAGVIRGADRGGALMQMATVFGNSCHTLRLTGAANGGWLQLPDGVLNLPTQSTGLTISFYCKLQVPKYYTTLCSFGTDSCFYLSALPDPEAPDKILISPGATKGGRSQEAALSQWLSVSADTWYHFTMTMDAAPQANITFYLDGKRAGTFVHRRMSVSDLLDCHDCFFGYGALSQCPAALSLGNLHLYHALLGDAEIGRLFAVTNEARLQMEAAELFTLFQEPVSSSISLPAKGKLMTTICWESMTSKVIASDGSLCRPPAGLPDACARLRATITYQESSLIQDFCFMVPAMPDTATLLSMDLDSVHLPWPEHVTAPLVLPTKGPNGSTFHWTSNREDIFSPATGQLHRPLDMPVKLVLVLTASLSGMQKDCSFSLKVWPDDSRLPAFDAPLHYAPATDARPLPVTHPIPLARISLKEHSLLGENQRRCCDYLLLLDADRMLYNFRKAFGQNTGSTPPPGGWEEPAGLLRGHSTGHMLSALALAFSATGNTAFLEKAEGMIQELYNLQQLSMGDPAAFQTVCTPSNAAQSLWSNTPATWGEGFLSAYSPDQFALLEQLTPYATIWAPYYTLHKLLAGFLDCFEHLQSEAALTCARGIGDWVYRRLSVIDASLRASMWRLYIAGEYGGMNESLARLYAITGESAYLEAAKMFDNPGIFDGLADNEDTIRGIHANQHIPQIIGALAEYEATHDPYYYRVARNFWYLVTNHYMYAIGGVGRGENFKEPDVLASHIESDRNCETCAAYNLLKLTGMLYRYEPTNSCYMDYYERTLINQIAASQNPVVMPHAHHGVTYMLPIGPGARREYSNDYEDFTCCHGTGMENHVRYMEHAYHVTDGEEQLYVNLFFSSTFALEKKQLFFTMHAPFPGETATLTITGDAALTLHIRIPDWCREEFCLFLNGMPLPKANDKSGYYTLSRTFHTGDTLTIHMPYRLHLCSTPDLLDQTHIASILYGPLVMTAISDTTDWITLRLPPVLEEAFTMKTAQMPVLWYDDLKFIPMYQAHNLPYHTYFKILPMGGA